MKKMVSLLLSFVILASTLGAYSFTPTPERPNATQFSLLSVMAVDISTTATGVRDYNRMVESKRVYKENDVITLALKTRSKNIAKAPNTNLASVADTDIKLSIGSNTIDLSYAKASAPVLTYDVYGAFTDTSIPNLVLPGYAPGSSMMTLDISRALTYDKGDNALKFVMRGVEKQSVNFLDYMDIAPYIKDNKIMIAALKAKDGKEDVTIGGSTTTVNIIAPEHIDYTVVVAGVVRNSNQGNFNSRMSIGSSDKFTGSGDLQVLDITNKYNVYRQLVKASDSSGPGESPADSKGYVKFKGQSVAQVNPQNKDNDGMNINWAGGLSVKDGELVTTKIHKNSAGNTLGENGIVVYTITDTKDAPIVTLVSEYTYYDGDSGKSIAMFEAGQNGTHARRINGAMGGSFSYMDNEPGTVENTDKIVEALKFFQLDTGIGSSYKLTDGVFEKKGNIISHSQSVDGFYQTTATAPPSPTPPGFYPDPNPNPTPHPTPRPTHRPDDDDDDLLEEEEVPKTGDATQGAAGLAALGILCAAAAAFSIFRRSVK